MNQTFVRFRGRGRCLAPTSPRRGEGFRCALWRITISRPRHDPRTRAYATRRTTEGLSKTEIIRCLRRYIARESYDVLDPRLTALDAP